MFSPQGVIMPRRATVITDASFCHETRASGWAAWIKLDGGEAIKTGGRLTSPINSTMAEVMAAGNGAWLAAKAGATHILLQSDCMAVIHCVKGQAQPGILKTLWQELQEMPVMAGVFVDARHVKGHGRIHDARTWVNDWCDRVAYQHMDGERARLRGSAGKKRRQSRSGGRAP